MFFRKFLFGVAFVAVSCSVLENRTDCPCHVHIDMNDDANYCSDSIRVNLAAGEYSASFVVNSSDYALGLDVDVPSRNSLVVGAVGDTYRDFSGGSGLHIPLGEQCPQSYMYFETCDISAEDADVYVSLHKNYCGISVSFSSPNPELYDMVVAGSVCGYSFDGSPVPGEFRFVPTFDENSMGFFCIPRQIDGSLRLGITSENGPTRWFALGNYILDSGYDWTKKDLEDIVVCIDYAATDIRISVDGWSIAEEYDVVI